MFLFILKVVVNNNITTYKILMDQNILLSLISPTLIIVTLVLSVFMKTHKHSLKRLIELETVFLEYEGQSQQK